MTRLSPTEIDALWDELDRRAMNDRFSHGALLQLIAFYRDLGREDREAVDRSVADWVGSDNIRKRFDALALIEEFNIRSARSALRADLERLDDVEGPSARANRAKLRRILEKLDE